MHPDDSRTARTHVVRITGDMDAEHRRAALRALASGATVVEMSAGFELLHGEAVSPYNRRMLRLAVLGGLLIGGGLAVGLGHRWAALVLVPGIAALMARIAIIDGTRRARVMVDDLQRIAVLAAGHRPRTTEARPPRKR